MAFKFPTSSHLKPVVGRGAKSRLYINGQRLLLLCLVLILFSLWREHEQQQQQQLSYLGVPKTTDSGPSHWLWHGRNPGFMVGYSEWLQNPLWVSYQLTAKPQRYSPPRPRNFSIDGRSLSRVSPEDYRRSGYDRGHLAPNYAISSEYGRAAQLASFKMTNISPQTQTLNQKLWQRLEEVVVDHFLARQGQLWIFTGPVFVDKAPRLRSGVAIPQAFYKIIVKPSSDQQALEAISFLMPQKVKGTEPLSQFLSSIDRIEAASGLDFLHQLPDEIEQALESAVSGRGNWNLKAVDQNPPRY